MSQKHLHLNMADQRQREEEEEESGLEDHTLVAGQRQTFVNKDGFAIAFYIHKSVNRQTQRRNLTNDIQVCSNVC